MKKVIDWGLFAAFLAVIGFFGAPASLGGATSFVMVDGGSMEPTYRHGDLIVARAANEYEVSDVITYDAPVGQTYRVIHRIIEITDDGYVTQGDNRDEADGWVVPFDAVHGASVLRIPWGGNAAMLLRQPPVLIGLASGWLTLTLLTRREKHGRDDDDTSDDDGSSDEAADGAPPAPRDRIGQLTTGALFGGMIAIGLGAGFVVASAASLVVDGGVLQVFTDDDPDIPPDDATDPVDPDPTEDVTVTIDRWLFDEGGNYEDAATDLPGSVTVEGNGTYHVASQEPLYRNDVRYLEVSCSTLSTSPAADRYDSGTHTAGEEAGQTHGICLQARELTITWYVFNPGNNDRAEHTTPAEVQDHGTYSVDDLPPDGLGPQDYEVVTCSTLDDEISAHQYGVGEFTAGTALTHAVCLQQQPGNDNGNGNGGGPE